MARLLRDDEYFEFGNGANKKGTGRKRQESAGQFRQSQDQENVSELLENLFAEMKLEPPFVGRPGRSSRMSRAVPSESEFNLSEDAPRPSLGGEDGGLAGLLPNWMVLPPSGLHIPAPITLALIALTVIVAILSPILAARMWLVMFLGMGIFGLIAAVILYQRPIIGLASISILSLMVPFSIGTGSQTGINATAILIVAMTGLWVLGMIARQGQIRVLPFRPITVALILCVVALVSFTFGQLNWFPTRSAPITAQVGGLMIFLLSVCTLLVYAHQVKSVEDLKWITAIFLVVGFVNIVLRSFDSLRPYLFTVYVREAMLGALFLTWLVSMAAGQLIFNHTLARGWRILIGALIVLFFYQHLGEYRSWVSGWLPATVSLFTIIFFYRPRLGFILGLAGLVLLLALPGVMSGLLNEGDNTYSVLTRIEAWKILWEIIKVSPLLGVGMANYYWYTTMFKILGYRVSFNSHNNYIDIAAQTGLIGLAVFIWFLWESLRLGLQTLKLVPEGFPKAYLIGVLGGLAGTAASGMLGDWILPFVYNIGLPGFRASVFTWVFLGGMLALAKFYLLPGQGEEHSAP